jgi:hypothetical protein
MTRRDNQLDLPGSLDKTAGWVITTDNPATARRRWAAASPASRRPSTRCGQASTASSGR